MKQVLFLAAFLSSSAVMAQAPGIVWEREYDNPLSFCDVMPSLDGQIICLAGASNDNVLFCYDLDGNLKWASDMQGVVSQQPMRMTVIPSGGYAITGTCKVQSSSSWDLFLAVFTGSGQFSWSSIVDRPSSVDVGYDIECMPDGSFAVCGYTQDPALGSQAWILRFNSEGDTLWTRTWGPTDCPDVAISIENSWSGISVLVDGVPESPIYVPVLLRYSSSGDLLWTTYEEFSGYPCDLCSISSGYALMRKPNIMSDGTTFYVLDEDGVIHQEIGVAAGGMHDMRRIRQTMDGGYLVAGADDYHDEPPDDWNAHLSRYSTDGAWMWTHSLESGDTNRFHSAAQLPLGGYVAAGVHSTYADVQKAYLVRFEPETGIQQPVLPSNLVLESCIPNPGTATFTLSWTIGLQATSDVRVYDVSGRLRFDAELGLVSEGQHFTQLDLQGLPSGCYLVVVSCGTERASTKLVILR
jgi:hypothetical protein